MWEIHKMSTPKTEHITISSLTEDGIKNGYCMNYSIFLQYATLGSVSYAVAWWHRKLMI